MKYSIIDRCRDAFPILTISRLFEVSPGGYNDWRTRPPSTMAIENDRLIQKIRQLHTESAGVIGDPRIREELHCQGLRCGKNRIASTDCGLDQLCY